MKFEKLEEIILAITSDVGCVPARSLLLNVGLNRQEADAFQKYLLSKGYEKLTTYKNNMIEQAKTTVEAQRLSIIYKLTNAISTSS